MEHTQQSRIAVGKSSVLMYVRQVQPPAETLQLVQVWSRARGTPDPGGFTFLGEGRTLLYHMSYCVRRPKTSETQVIGLKPYSESIGPESSVMSASKVAQVDSVRPGKPFFR